MVLMHFKDVAKPGKKNIQVDEVPVTRDKFHLLQQVTLQTKMLFLHDIYISMWSLMFRLLSPTLLVTFLFVCLFYHC